MGFATLIGSRTARKRLARSLLLSFWALAAAADVRAEPFRFPWDPPPAPPPLRRLAPPERNLPPPELVPAPQRLTTRQVREILAREGAQLIGKPRAIRDELIAIGRDSDGLGRKFILDAVSGEVLSVLDVGLPDQARRRDVDRLDLPPPGTGPGDGVGNGLGNGLGTGLGTGLADPMPPPVHVSPDLGGRPPAAAEPSRPPVAEPSRPPATIAASPAAPPPQPAPAPPPAPLADPDAALSPIKPLRSPGAPKVEPLPQ